MAAGDLAFQLSITCLTRLKVSFVEILQYRHIPSIGQLRRPEMFDYSAQTNTQRAFEAAHQERAEAIRSAWKWLFGARKVN
jgi:hypothetical protein